MGEIIQFSKKKKKLDQQAQNENQVPKSCREIAAGWLERPGMTERLVLDAFIDFLEIHFYNLVEAEAGEKQAERIFQQLPELLLDSSESKLSRALLLKELENDNEE